MPSTIPLTPVFSSLLDKLSDDVIWLSMTHMHIGQLTSFKRVSQTTDAFVTEYFAHRLHSLLARFFTHPDVFHGVMRNSHSVISGSCALQFILPADIQWTPADMDLYVPQAHFTHVVAHLEVFQKYAHMPPGDIQNHYNGGISQVMRLKNGSHQIDVIQSASDSALYPLVFFWTTAVMNWVSADSVCCAYPDLTLHNRALISPNNLIAHTTPDEHTTPLIEKYTARRFDVRVREPTWSHGQLDPATNIATPLCSCAASMRFFGDAHCIRTSFHPYIANELDLLDRQHLTVRWHRGGPPCGVGCSSTMPSVRPITDTIVM